MTLMKCNAVPNLCFVLSLTALTILSGCTRYPELPELPIEPIRTPVAEVPEVPKAPAPVVTQQVPTEAVPEVAPEVVPEVVLESVQIAAPEIDPQVAIRANTAVTASRVESSQATPNSETGEVFFSEQAPNTGCPDIVELKPLDSGGCTLTLKAQQEVTFMINSDSLTAGALVILNKVVDAFSGNPNLLIEVAAHTDNRGNPARNLELSARRGQAVARYLQSRGIAQDQIFARAYAGERPIASNNTITGRRANRRVEFKFIQ